MKGLELAEGYYSEFCKEQIKEAFPECFDRLCFALAGEGSECFGFDDEISTDHDFEPGFCIFIPGEDVIDRRTAFQLERFYAKLPKEYAGYRRSPVSPVGGSRHGVILIEDFFRNKTGSPDGNLSINQWLSIPEYSLAEAVNGKVFLDNYGLFTKIRANLSSMPADIRLKRLAGNLLLMAQSGQYNYARIIRHGETAAAQLAVNEYVNAGMSAVFLLNNKYKPFYKWSFRAMNELEYKPECSSELEYLLCSGNTGADVEKKIIIIEKFASEIIDRLVSEGITSAVCGDLEKHAYSVNDHISDSNIRNLNILYGV